MPANVVTISVGTSPTRILAANPKRLVYVILNPSNYDVYIGFNSNVSTTGKTKGILVASGGGVWADEYTKDEVWAIATTETEITVMEVSEE